jgi:hypothetical protein
MTLRPRDFALLLLASGDLRPRQRARDQRADETGLAIQRRLLERLAEIDPEPGDLEATLLRLVEELGPPTGPSRTIAAIILEDWTLASSNPDWLSLLIERATGETSHAPRVSS